MCAYIIVFEKMRLEPWSDVEEGVFYNVVSFALQGVLVHEVDEGQPCLTCKDKCPGFSPHLWRKVCNNCKCPRESHDVYHEEFVNVRDRIGIKASDPFAAHFQGEDAAGGLLLGASGTL
ncbi:hypothetical protein MTO96_048763 [Rhipicephalus appendiculatus]